MISHSDDYVEYCLEIAKSAREPHGLAIRGRNKKEITRRIHERIVEAVELHSGDDLVDIGCGDGTLLRMAAHSGANAVGLLATQEEVALLRKFGMEAKPGTYRSAPASQGVRIGGGV